MNASPIWSEVRLHQTEHPYALPATYNYTYNARGELTDAADYLGTNVTLSANQLSGRHFAYGFDNIGNRASASRTGTAGAPDLFKVESTPLAPTAHPELNQYSSRENNVAHTAGTAQTTSAIAVTGTNGATASAVARQGRYWDAQATLANTGGPATSTLTVTGTLSGSPTLVRTDNSRTAFLPPQTQYFSYDDDGNLIGDGIWNYVYDAENRLVQMTTTSSAVTAGFPNRTLEFKYDYLGRRVQKRSENLSAVPNTDVYRRYLYDGDNLVAEFDATSSSCGALLRSYTWGLDLAGSLTATDGVGALVQITDHATSTSYFPTFDGKISAYLQCIFGAGARAQVDREDNKFTGLRLFRPGFGNAPFDFDTLSGGAKEQTAAAVRLAMAEVLATDYDGCLPVVFDDAFAYSDPERVNQLQRMLDLAATRGLQVIVLTCNQADYASLGAKTIVIRPESYVPQARGNPPT